MRSSAIAVIGMLLLSSCLAGSSLTQPLKMQSEAPAHLQGFRYKVTGPGIVNGLLVKNYQSTWVIGGKAGKLITDFYAYSDNDGINLTGYMEYQDDYWKSWFSTSGTSSFAPFNTYFVSARYPVNRVLQDFRRETDWVLGGRSDKRLVSVYFSGDGTNMKGKATYQGEAEYDIVITRL